MAGGSGRNRTFDARIKSLLLSHLSYRSPCRSTPATVLSYKCASPQMPLPVRIVVNIHLGDQPAVCRPVGNLYAHWIAIFSSPRRMGRADYLYKRCRFLHVNRSLCLFRRHLSVVRAFFAMGILLSQSHPAGAIAASLSIFRRIELYRI